MNKPTGKLAFAYDTTTKLEAEVKSLRAALAAQPGAVLNLTLTRTEVEYIAAFVSAEDNEPADDVVTLMVGNGHSGYGLYAAHPEYPEEGAVFVRALAAAPTEAMPAQQDAVDAELLDWLEAQINEHGAIHLHDGNNPNGHGLGLRPGSLKRTLRDAIRAAISAKKGGA